MSNLRLSIIIPFYNVEKYIAECLDSVYAQDIPESEYEVICVNDCSPDNSRQIVLEYQKKHDNLILIEHETNKMLGAARNTGLRAAQGKYVWFIDSDDYIVQNVLNTLLLVAEQNYLEILQFNLVKFSIEPTNFDEYGIIHLTTLVITGIDFLKIKFPFWRKPLGATSKIYNRTFFIKSNLFFPEGVFYEDTLPGLLGIICATRFMHIDKTVYNYRITSQSIMNSFQGGIKCADKILDCCVCLKLISDKSLDNNIEFPDLVETFIHRVTALRKHIFYLSNRERMLFFDRIKNVDTNILKGKLSNFEFFQYKYPKIYLFIYFLYH
jgi:glycosyltransferase involved in cell wall biosynthesis